LIQTIILLLLAMPLGLVLAKMLLPLIEAFAESITGMDYTIKAGSGSVITGTLLFLKCSGSLCLT